MLTSTFYLQMHPTLPVADLDILSASTIFEKS
jgi:hypothetical protein